MSAIVESGFRCQQCYKFHPFTAYTLAHPEQHLEYTCECGALHRIWNGQVILIKGILNYSTNKAKVINEK